MQDPSRICNLYHRSRQHWILNLLSKVRDQTCILMDTSRVHTLLSHSRKSQAAASSSSSSFFFNLLFFVILRAAPEACGGSQARGLLAYATATATPDLSWSVTYTTANSNARSLTHWARQGIEPATSWFLVRFVNHWATMGTPPSFFFYSNWMVLFAILTILT